MIQNIKLSFKSDHRGKIRETSAEWLNGCPNPDTEGKQNKKPENRKTETKEQNSLAASLRTCSSFSRSEYSHSATVTAAAAPA